MTMRNKRYLDNISFRSKNGVLTAEPNFDDDYVLSLVERSGAIELYGYKNIDGLLDDFMVSVEASYDYKTDTTELKLYLLKDINEDSSQNRCIRFTEDFLSKDEIEDVKDMLIYAQEIQRSLPEAER